MVEAIGAVGSMGEAGEGNRRKAGDRETGDHALGPGFLTGLACCLAALIGVACHFEAPWWAAISAWVVSNRDPLAVRKKGAARALGMVLGAVIGYFAAALFAGRPVPQAAFLFAAGAIGTAMRFRSREGYSWVFGTVVAMMIVTDTLNPPVVLYRVAYSWAFESMIGALVAALLHGFIGPWLGIVPHVANAREHPLPSDTPYSPASLPPGLPGASLIAGLTSVLITILWSAFDLPSLAQSMTTVLVLIDLNTATSRHRATQRLLGCFTGGLAGFLASAYAGDSLFLWSVVFIVGIMVFANLHLNAGPWAYLGTQGGIGYIMTLVTGFGPPSTLVPVASRLIGIMLGVLVITAVAALVRFVTPEEPPSVSNPANP